MNTFSTARALMAHLTTFGVTGEAAQAVVRETGEARNAARAAATWAAAFDAAEAFAPESPILGAFAVMILDAAGVGGRDACEGLATRRLPPMSRLGSGRWQATDGGAYRAALERALWSGLRESYGDAYQPLVLEGGAEGLSVEGGMSELRHAEWFAVSQFPADWLPWVRCVAREGLRLSLGMPGWTRLVSDTACQGVLRWGGTPAGWAALVNAVQAAEATPTQVASSPIAEPPTVNAVQAAEATPTAEVFYGQSTPAEEINVLRVWLRSQRACQDRSEAALACSSLEEAFERATPSDLDWLAERGICSVGGLRETLG